MPADGQPVLISELAPPLRQLLLGNRDRPEQGVAVASRQRAQQTWYPGASKASVQVLGFTEDDITLNGIWHDDVASLLQQGPELLVSIARGLLQGQQLCQLTWGTTIVRTGRMAGFTSTYIRDRVVQYEIRFAVDQANEAVALSPEPSVAKVLLDLKKGVDAARTAIDTAIEVVDTVKTIGALVL